MLKYGATFLPIPSPLWLICGLRKVVPGAFVNALLSWSTVGLMKDDERWWTCCLGIAWGTWFRKCSEQPEKLSYIYTYIYKISNIFQLPFASSWRGSSDLSQSSSWAACQGDTVWAGILWTLKVHKKRRKTNKQHEITSKNNMFIYGILIFFDYLLLTRNLCPKRS